MNMMIHIDELTKNGVQTRVGLDNDTVAEYADLLRSGTELPPVSVIRDGTTFRLTDGFHRLAACTAIGRDTIAAEVVKGTQTDALRAALQANARHGLRRTNADKRRALEIAWKNRNLLFSKNPTERELAEICAVSNFMAHTFIENNDLLLNSKTGLLPHNSQSENLAESDEGDEEIERADEPTVKGNLSKGLDRYGMEIPKKLLPVFHSAPLRRLYRMSRTLRKAVATELEAGNPVFAAVSQRVLVDLDNATRELKFSLPHCVCRGCHGEGCHRCGKLGFQTILQYKALPREYKG